ncbi:hypothetical protein LCGC14_1344570 [marine sediment metagenome]|uniref:Uncharacterized protein n=1 Tax=marine sediment metagenome TaxID=412755 RepID=A0A0F9KDD6_9ZZZZ
MNKKSKLISIFFIGSLLFISSINVGKAAPPSWVGVNVGDSFTWTITAYRDSAITLLTDLGLAAEIPSNITDEVAAQEEVQISVEILSITDLMTSNGMEYVNVSCSLSLVMPGTTTIEDILEFGNLIVKYVPTNYTGQFMNLGEIEMGYSIGALFIPTDINWAELITEVNAMMNMITVVPSGLSVEALTNGVRVTYAEVPPMDEIIGTITYNSNGVLNTVEIRYGGDLLLKVALSGGEGEIPSYEVSIVLITTLGTSIGIIYYIKKKKRFGLET